MHSLFYRTLCLLALAVLTAAGCKSTTPGKLSVVQPTSDAPRAGNAYLLRGFIGIFSEGIDHLTDEINKNGVRAHVFQDDQWLVLANTIREKYKADPNHEPIVLVGHSYGADDVVRIARKLSEDKISVELLVTLDPVTPPKVPGNVKQCVNLYQSNGAMDALPWLRGIPLEADKPGPAKLVNANIRKDRTDLLEPGVDHFNIEKKAKIHTEIVKQVLAVCPPRQTWVALIASKNEAIAATPLNVQTDVKNDAVHPVSLSNSGGGDRQEPN